MAASFVHDDVSEVIHSPTEIQARVSELGAQISAAFAGKKLLVVGVLTGPCTATAAPQSLTMDGQVHPCLWQT